MNTMAAPTPIKHVKTRGMTEARIHALYEAISDANNNKYTELSELLIEEWRVLLVKKRVWMEEKIFEEKARRKSEIDKKEQVIEETKRAMDMNRQTSREIQEEWSGHGQVWNEESERLMDVTSRLTEKMDELHGKLFNLNEKEKIAKKFMPPGTTKKRVVI